MSENKYTNKDKRKEMKKFFDQKKRKNFTGKIMKPRKDYKAAIVNPLKPDFTLDSYDVMMEKDRKRELQKKRYGRELKENELEVNRGGLITKKYVNPVKIVNNLKKK